MVIPLFSPLKAGHTAERNRTHALRGSPFVKSPWFGKVNLAGTNSLQTIDTEATMSKILPETELNDGFEDEEQSPNIVRIVKKRSMNYVIACVTLLNTGDLEVMMRA